MKINYIDFFSRVKKLVLEQTRIGYGQCRQSEKFANNTMMMSW